MQALYQLVLSRTGSTTEARGWVNLLPQINQQGVALAFLQSQEYRGDLFNGNYNILLHRSPDVLGLQGWIFSSLNATGVRIGFESSAEFYSNG